MIEEQVEKERLASDFKWKLATDESESPTELQKKVAEMNQQTPFQFPLFGARGQRQKIELVRVFKELFRQVGAFRRKGLGEVRDGFALTLVQSLAI